MVQFNIICFDGNGKCFGINIPLVNKEGEKLCKTKI